MEHKTYRGYKYWYDNFYTRWFACKVDSIKNTGTIKAVSQEVIRREIDKRVSI